MLAHSSQYSKNTKHKLGVDVPFHDVRPPSGILIAALETIELEIAISKHPQPEYEVNQSPNTDILPLCSETLLRCRSFDTLHSFISSEQSEAMLELPSATREDQEPDDTGIVAESVDGEADDIDLDMLLEAENNQQAAQKDPTSAIMKLLDVALRRAMSSSPSHAAEGIITQSNASLRALSSIAPFMFRPGHLSGVAGRAVFLPTINRSIANVCSRPATVDQSKRRCNASLTMQAKKLVKRVSDCTMISAKFAAGPGPSILLSQRLWWKLDKILQKTAPEKRLKPLSTNTITPQDLQLDDCLLDAQVEPEFDGNISPGAQYNDLEFDSGFDNDSTSEPDSLLDNGSPSFEDGDDLLDEHDFAGSLDNDSLYESDDLFA